MMRYRSMPPVVIPAQAGIQCAPIKSNDDGSVDSRLRGSDGFIEAPLCERAGVFFAGRRQQFQRLTGRGQDSA